MSSDTSQEWPFVTLTIAGRDRHYHMAEEEYRHLLEWLRVGKSTALTLVVAQHPADTKYVLTLTHGSVQAVSREI